MLEGVDLGGKSQGGRQRELSLIRLAIEEGKEEYKASGTSAFAVYIIFTVTDGER